MKMLNYLQKLDKIQRKKEFYMKLYRQDKQAPRKNTGMLCFQKVGPPLKDYYG